jgi:hypothetical protein
MYKIDRTKVLFQIYLIALSVLQHARALPFMQKVALNLFLEQKLHMTEALLHSQ